MSELANYKIGKTLGGGTFGKVKCNINVVAEHEITKQRVAIKILNRRQIKTHKMTEKVRREIKILKLFHHPHIVRL